MPENEARVWAFYDHETEEPRATGRRRRQVADWGVGDDAFDRLPSHRFARSGRRGDDTGEHRRSPRAEVADQGEAPPRAVADRRYEPPRAVADRRDEPPRAVADRRDEPRREPADAGDELRFAREGRRRRRPAADWLAEVSPLPAEPEATAAEDSGARPDTDSRRTIVLGGAANGEIAPPDDSSGARKPRRTIVIGGHPDRLPAPRARRPPRTAVERLGHSPDRIVAYAVALGFLLILIAVLTTSQ